MSHPAAPRARRASRAELVAERAAQQLRNRGLRVGGGVQNTLDAALQRDAKLTAVLTMLAARHREGMGAVQHCLRNVYHRLSAPFHSTDGHVFVRQQDFPVGAERCAVCGLLEAYDVGYVYYGPSGDELPQSPYALTPEERASVAAAERAAAADVAPAAGQPSD